MLDVLDLIADRGGNPDRVRDSQRRRHDKVEYVDEVIALWGEHQKIHYQSTRVASQVNALIKQIGAKRKAKEDAADLMKEKADLEQERKSLQEQAAEKEKLMSTTLGKIGNIVHDSIPVSNDEDNNSVLRTWVPDGVNLEKKDCLSHHDVLHRLDAFDPVRGVKVAGHRGYFLKGRGLQLTHALIRYGLDFLGDRGYTEIQAPHFMFGTLMARTAQISQFDEELYKVEDADSEGDKYLIATSEQPLSALHASEWLTKNEVPLKYAGYSKCFRKEAGGHGRDTWGIYRVHEFDKVEQFVLTDPDKSWEMLDDMIKISEEFYQSLGLPYRVVDIVTGALNNAAARKFDLEVWFPFQGEYKELVSCSNCTDYQSRGLDIRFGAKTQTDARKTYVHCLNATLCATTRTVSAIAETFQTQEGVKVPGVLRPYLKGAPEMFEFTKELPKNATSTKLVSNQTRKGAKEAK